MSDDRQRPRQLFSTRGHDFEAIVDRFEDAWQAGVPPAIDEFLPMATDQRRAALVALVAVDLEYRWKLTNSLDSGAGVLDSTVPPKPTTRLPPRPRIEDYLREFSELGAIDADFLEVIAAEYRARRRWGDRPAHDEYASRFPGCSDRLAEVLSRVETAATRKGAADIHGADTVAHNECKYEAIVGSSPPTVTGFEILGPLGRGGMGVVYKARQINLNRIVALKMIGGGRLADREEVRRFLAEAQAAASLKHPNIVAIHDVGEHEGQPYFTMDYISAGNLADRLREQPLPPECAARYLQQVADLLGRPSLTTRRLTLAQTLSFRNPFLTLGRRRRWMPGTNISTRSLRIMPKSSRSFVPRSLRRHRRPSFHELVPRSSSGRAPC
ncbi:MAG TPA: serine/threonine-protein kinase [Pirellulales bacterium]|nr:serine/threonine-protein kinase [Pirellulales bacterium]